ncbi:MAG: hypothetical protein JST82_05670 [Bacteroidetes bacterium]|nr:hypothetical protein [Bacteroidota bacterium]
MRIKILMVTNKLGAQEADAEMLKSRGLLVYNCTEDVLNFMITEVRPDVVFINPDNPGLHSTKVYHQLLQDRKYASLPVIYSLCEDDAYLVSRSRNAANDARNLMADNILDGIKLALLPDESKKHHLHAHTLSNQLSLWGNGYHSRKAS